MPFAVTHVIMSIVSVDLYRDYVTKHKRYFTLLTIFIAGVGGILPDIDIPIKWVLDFMNLRTPEILMHGGITHTPFFAFLFFLPGWMLWLNKKHKWAMYFYVIVFGIVLHIFLDWLLGGGAYEGVMWLFPFTTHAWKLHLLGKAGNWPPALDAVILLAWLWHEEYKHKIRDFI